MATISSRRRCSNSAASAPARSWRPTGSWSLAAAFELGDPNDRQGATPPQEIGNNFEVGLAVARPQLEYLPLHRCIDGGDWRDRLGAWRAHANPAAGRPRDR